MFDVTKTNLFNGKSLSVEVVPTFHPQKGIRVALFRSRIIHLVVLFLPITSALKSPFFFNFATELVTIAVKHQSPVRYDSTRWDKRRERVMRTSTSSDRIAPQFNGNFDFSLRTSTSSKKNLAQVQKRILHKFKKESCTRSKKNLANLLHYVKDKHKFEKGSHTIPRKPWHLTHVHAGVSLKCARF